MGRLVKLLGSGIGLASEAIAHHKASKAASSSNVNDNAGEGSSASASHHTPGNDAPPQYVEVPDDQAEELIASGKAVPADSKDEKTLHNEEEDDDAISEEGDEEQWELDDAANEADGPSEEEPRQTEAQLFDQFTRTHPPPQYTPSESGAVRGQLPCPVIIPQRRPKDKKRGFVRAYAPVLADCGIDQATFLDFLKTFHAASKEAPWLHVVNIAAAGVGMVPMPITMAVSMTIQVVVGVSMEVQRRTRSVYLLILSGPD